MQLEVLTQSSCFIANLIDIEETIKKGPKGMNNAEKDDNVADYKTSSDFSKVHFYTVKTRN